MSEPGPRRDELVDVAIESLAAGGDAVGRAADGRVVFVPCAAPGERVRARVVESRRQWMRAELVAVTEASPERVEPPCPLFRARTCGGCAWQHVDYPAQARAKRRSSGRSGDFR